VSRVQLLRDGDEKGRKGEMRERKGSEEPALLTKNCSRAPAYAAITKAFWLDDIQEIITG